MILMNMLLHSLTDKAFNNVIHLCHDQCCFYHRLKDLLRTRLIECGWRDQLKQHCKGMVYYLLAEHCKGTLIMDP